MAKLCRVSNVIRSYMQSLALWARSGRQTCRLCTAAGAGPIASTGWCRLRREGPADPMLTGVTALLRGFTFCEERLDFSLFPSHNVKR